MWPWMMGLVMLGAAAWPSRRASRVAAAGATVCLGAMLALGVARWRASGSPRVDSIEALRPIGLGSAGTLQIDITAALLAATVLTLGVLLLPVIRWRRAESARVAAVLLPAALGVVMAGDLGTLYLAWCVSGLATGALVGRPAGRRYWLATRVGDLGLLLAILLLVWQTGTISLVEIVARVGFVWGSGHPAATVAGIAVVVAAITRIAAVPLQCRAVDVARTRPGPATLILALSPLLGLALLARLYPVLYLSAPALAAAASLGAVTAISASLSAASRSGSDGLAFSAVAHGGLALTGMAAGGAGVGLALGVAHAGARAMAFLVTGLLAARPGDSSVRIGTGLLATVAAVSLAGFPWITATGVAVADVLRVAPSGPIGNPSLALLLVLAMLGMAFHAARWWWELVDGARAWPARAGAGIGGRGAALASCCVLAGLQLLGGPPQAATGGWVARLVGPGEVPAGVERVEVTASALGGFTTPLLAVVALAGVVLALGLVALRPEIGRELAARAFPRRLRQLAGAGWYMDAMLERLVAVPLRRVVARAGAAVDGLQPAAAPGWRRARSWPVRVLGPALVLVVLLGWTPLEPSWSGRAAMMPAPDGLALAFLGALALGPVAALLACGGWRRGELAVALLAAAATLSVADAGLKALLWAVAVAAAAGPAGRAAGRPVAWGVGGLLATGPALLVVAVGESTSTAVPGAWASATAAWSAVVGISLLAPALVPRGSAAALVFPGLGAVAADSALRAAALRPSYSDPLVVVGLATLLVGSTASAGARSPGGRAAGWGLASAGVALLGLGTGSDAGLQGAAVLLCATFLALPWLLAEAAGGAAAREPGRLGGAGRMLRLVLAGFPGGLPFVGQVLCITALLAIVPGTALLAVAGLLPLSLGAARQAELPGMPPSSRGVSRRGAVLAAVLLLVAGLVPGPLLDITRDALADVARRAVPMEPADPEILEGDDRLVTDSPAAGPGGSSAGEVSEEEPQVGRPLGEPTHEPRVPALAEADVDAQG